jgi:hypothetical protein
MKECRGYLFGFFLAIVMIFSWTAPGYGAHFLGPEKCMQCHDDEYNWWRASGHPYKLRKADEARISGLPLPKGYTWDDISYVIGGFNWKARYMDKKGYIITAAKDGSPAPTQYNIRTGRWVNYHAGEKKKYDCGRCHTTAYSKKGRQDGLEGIVGTWELTGITCEECHGPASEHVAKRGAAGTIKVERSATLCGRCHIRGAKNEIPASKGFIRHHEQYNELLAGPHKAISCITCHDPHKRAAFSMKIKCEQCHKKEAQDFTGSKMQRAGKTCIDCHMARATKSAEAKGHFEGDVRTHLFTINIDPKASMFYKEGKKELARGFLTVDFACLDCHQDRDKSWALKNAKGVHAVGK